MHVSFVSFQITTLRYVTPRAAADHTIPFFVRPNNGIIMIPTINRLGLSSSIPTVASRLAEVGLACLGLAEYLNHLAMDDGNHFFTILHQLVADDTNMGILPEFSLLPAPT